MVDGKSNQAGYEYADEIDPGRGWPARGKSSLKIEVGHVFVVLLTGVPAVKPNGHPTMVSKSLVTRLMEG